MNTIGTKTTTRLLVALTIAAGLATAIVTGSAVASADDRDTQTKILEITQQTTLDKSRLPHPGDQAVLDYIRG